jgi:hypothetical protein
MSETANLRRDVIHAQLVDTICLALDLDSEKMFCCTALLFLSNLEVNMQNQYAKVVRPCE